MLFFSITDGCFCYYSSLFASVIRSCFMLFSNQPLSSRLLALSWWEMCRWWRKWLLMMIWHPISRFRLCKVQQQQQRRTQHNNFTAQWFHFPNRYNNVCVFDVRCAYNLTARERSLTHFYIRMLHNILATWGICEIAARSHGDRLFPTYSSRQQDKNSLIRGKKIRRKI